MRTNTLHIKQYYSARASEKTVPDLRRSLWERHIWVITEHLTFVSEFYQYKLSMDILSPFQHLKDLGILVSQDLSWFTHIRSTCNKARQKSCWVLSVFFTRSPTVMLNLYKSMVRSLLKYCSPLWSPTNITDIQELESVQRTFTSRISGCHDLDY